MHNNASTTKSEIFCAFLCSQENNQDAENEKCDIPILLLVVVVVVVAAEMNLIEAIFLKCA